MLSRKVARVVGLPLVTRTAESPRPIPITVRLPYISFNVANRLAVTVQSRVAGFVTIGPTMTFRVSAKICAKIGNGSCHKIWLSKVQTCVNPYVSAFFAKSITRALGGVVWSTTPMSILLSTYSAESRDRLCWFGDQANVMSLLCYGCKKRSRRDRTCVGHQTNWPSTHQMSNTKPEQESAH